MKRMATILGATLFGVGISFAQIPNAGFESWTNGEPDNWTTNNNSPSYVTLSQSATAHSGSSAILGQVASFSSFGFPPVLESGVRGKGFAYAGRPGVFTGFYQFTPVSGDIMEMTILLTKGGVQGTAVAGGSGLISTAVSSYTSFSVPLLYVTSDVPDTAYITFIIASTGGLTHVGSSFLLDDLALSGTAAVAGDPSQVPQSFSLNQNYPNPFNPTTTIRYGLPHRMQVTLTVFNSLGQQVKELVNGEVDAGYHDVKFDGSGLASGMYFYRIQSGSFVQTKTLLLVK